MAALHDEIGRAVWAIAAQDGACMPTEAWQVRAIRDRNTAPLSGPNTGTAIRDRTTAPHARRIEPRHRTVAGLNPSHTGRAPAANPAPHARRTPSGTQRPQTAAAVAPSCRASLPC
eukprot:4205876-Prymnesium_polylepis.1